MNEDNKHFLKNLLISFFIITVFLIFWQKYMAKKYQRPVKASKDTAVSRSANVQSIKPTQNVLKDSVILTYESAKIRAEFTNYGAISQIYLKKYHIPLLTENGARLFLTDTLNYQIVSHGNTVKMVSSDSTVIKYFEFIPDSYLVRVRIIKNKPAIKLIGGLYLDPEHHKEEQNIFAFIFKQKNDFKKVKFKDILKKKQRFYYDLKPLDYIGWRSKYFMLALINPEHYSGKVIVSAIYPDVPMIEVQSDKADTLNFLLYAGPIDYFFLKKLGYGLSAVYDFGNIILTPFSMAILYILNFFHNFISNWGVVILLFALLMKLLFFPLTYKGLSAMRKMQRLKPEIEKLQKVYKNDPERLQREIMKLYAEHGVNPFSGCLTFIVQLPVFWALYKILRNTIELRGAEFILWIKDLSSKDPYYILPILMGLTSLLQSKLQQVGEEGQNKMFTYLMPVFLIVIFASLPSGIVLYWFFYNILSVIELLIIKRLEVS